MLGVEMVSSVRNVPVGTDIETFRPYSCVTFKTLKGEMKKDVN
jgi:hypothetical protein